MDKRIPNSLINEAINRTNIVDLINSRIKLKKNGNNFCTHCPFHNENHPSFTVNENKQFFYCFGCGVHGNVIDFLMKYDKLSFVEAVIELTSINNININYYDNSINREIINKQELYSLMNNLNEFYKNNLMKTSSKLVKNYLRQRGLNKKIIQFFSIGFADNEKSNVIKKFGTNSKQILLLNKIGILAKNNTGKIYDRFQKRIIFPIRNQKGQVIAFGGRVLNNYTPKYLNSSETDIFKKNRQLYGLYEILKTNKKNIDYLLVVEGYMDVITLTQFGIKYVVASLGTSTTIEQIQLLYRITNKIICCYDGDKAGQKAAWRTLKIASSYLTDDRQLYFITLPEQNDPDTTIKKIGKNKFAKLITQATPMSIFLFDYNVTGINLNTIEDRAKLSTLILPIINKIPGKILKNCLRKELGKKIGIPDDQYLEKITQKKIYINHAKSYLQIRSRSLKILLALLIQNPKLANLINTIQGLEDIKEPENMMFLAIIKLCKKNTQLTTVQLLENYRNHQFHLKLEKLACWNHMIKQNKIETTFIDTLINLYNDILTQYQNKLIAQDKMSKLTMNKRKEIWTLNKILKKS